MQTFHLMRLLTSTTPSVGRGPSVVVPSYVMNVNLINLNQRYLAFRCVILRVLVSEKPCQIFSRSMRMFSTKAGRRCWHKLGEFLLLVADIQLVGTQDQ